MATFSYHFPYWPKGLAKSLALPQTDLCYNLDVAARRYPERVAVHFYDGSLTYRQLQQQVNAVAGYLQHQLGVGKGDRVVMYLQNCSQFIITLYALWRIAAVAVPVNPMSVTKEVRSKVVDAGATVAFVGQELLEQAQPMLQDGSLQHLVSVAYGEYADPSTDLNMPEAVRAAAQSVDASGMSTWKQALAETRKATLPGAQPQDLCVVLYTSGTTGEAKGCMHPHASVMHTAVGSAVISRMHADSVVLCSVPMFHVTGLQHCINNTIFAGGSVVVMTRWDRDLALELMHRHRITHWTNAPTMVVDVLSSPQALQMDWSSLSYIGGGGAAMPEAIAQRLHDLSGLSYCEGFGSTETISQTHWNPPHRPKKQCGGMPTFDTDSRVINPDTLAELGPNEVGEIISAGPQIMLGYWNKLEATAASFVEIDGKRFFRTGDLGRYDEEGYFFIVDRLKRMINAAGFKVWPAEVESTLYSHPAVQEACIIASPDARRGETVKAVLVLKPEQRGKVSEEDVIAWSRQNMSAYKVPRVVQFVDALPKSATGKIQWRMLQEQEFS